MYNLDLYFRGHECKLIFTLTFLKQSRDPGLVSVSGSLQSNAGRA